MDLTRAFPAPRPIHAAGRARTVGPLQVRDLARLQRWINLRDPRPLDALRPLLAAMTPAAREAALRDAYRAEKAFPHFGTPEAASACDGPGWLAILCLVVFGKYDGSLTAEGAAEIALAIAPEELDATLRVAFDADPRDEIERRLGVGPAPGGEPVDWGRIAFEVIEATGYTFDQVADLHLGQLAAIRRRGAPRAHGRAILPGEDLDRLVWGDARAAEGGRPAETTTTTTTTTGGAADGQ